MSLRYIAKLISLIVGLTGFWTLVYYVSLSEEKVAAFEKISSQIGLPLSQSHGLLLFFGAGLLSLLIFWKERGVARVSLLSIVTLVLALTGIAWVTGFQIVQLGFVPVQTKPLGFWQPLIMSIIGLTALLFPKNTAAVALICGLASVIIGAIGFFSVPAVGPLLAAILGVGFILEGVHQIRTE